jgi:LysM repeat protein
MRVQYEASYPVQPLQEVQIASADDTAEAEEPGPPVRQASLETTADASASQQESTSQNEDASDEASAESESAERAETYTVRRGDTLSEIAAQHGVRASDLRRWNGLASSRINVGQTLRLTPGEPKEATTSYTVRRGDTLSEIAEQFGTSIRSIRQQNGLSGSSIRVGQRLTIPMGATSSQVVHRVRRGDTIGGIARRYGVSISQVKRWNGINGSTIFPGQRLVIMQ